MSLEGSLSKSLMTKIVGIVSEGMTAAEEHMMAGVVGLAVVKGRK